jgi:hypothetical protein
MEKYIFLITKPTICNNFPNLFLKETLHVSDNSSVHHQEFFHCTQSNGICYTVLLTAASRIRIIREISASDWFYYKKFVTITMHGHMNVKYIFIVTWQHTVTGQPAADVGQEFCVGRYHHSMYRQRAYLGLAYHQITDDVHYRDMISQPEGGRR